MNLPPELEKFLQRIGINVTRIKWKWRQRQMNQQQAAPEPTHKRQYKTCRYCGHLALANDTVCSCGRKLPSYTVYRISKWLALDRPDVTLVSTGFVGTIIVLFAFLVLFDGPKAIINPTLESTYFFGFLAGGLIDDGQYWRIFSMALCHGGIIHIAFNAMAISQLLPPFEKVIGRWRTLILITLTQIGAVIAHLMWYPPNLPTLGASGIAFGLIGFGLAFAHRIQNRALRDRFWHWCIYGLLFGFFLRANNAAHIGGFLSGLPLGYWMAGRQPRGNMRTGIAFAGAFCLALWLISMLFLLNSIRQGIVYKWFTPKQSSALILPADYGEKSHPGLTPETEALFKRWKGMA